MEEEMPDALQVPDPEGFIIHANELGLYYELHHKGFYAGRYCDQVGA